jgi:hypothetical protein
MRLTFKRLLKPRSIGKLALLIFLFYAFYILGLFTHLFETNLSEFNYPIKINIEIALQSFYRDPNTTKFLELDEFNFTYIHKAENMCKEEESEQPFLLILVKSKISHFEQRQVIRETWGQSDSKQLVRTVFLAGLPSPLEDESPARTQNFHVDLEGLHHNAEIIHKQSRIFKNELNVKDKQILNQLKHEDMLYKFELEYEKYGDIVQQNFYDSYYNNTIKTLMGIRWAVDYCSKSKFYLFVDDDFYVNPNLLIKFLSQKFNQTTLEKFYAGYV